jgi:hypothetical protein
MVLLLGRGLPELTAHSAYSGFFGYFIGLSVLRPGMAVLLIPLGWLSAAVLHGAWDATNDLVDSALIGVSVQVVIGVLSYSLLAGAIFKARDISPSFAARCQQALPQGIAPAIDLVPASMPRPDTDAADGRVSREVKKDSKKPHETITAPRPRSSRKSWPIG